MEDLGLESTENIIFIMMRNIILLLILLTTVNTIGAKNPVEAPIIIPTVIDDGVVIEIEWPESDGTQVYEGQYFYHRRDTNYVEHIHAYVTEGPTCYESEHIDTTILIPKKLSDNPWVVIIDRYGEEHNFELYPDESYEHMVMVSIDFETYGGYRPNIDPVRQVPFYFLFNGVRGCPDGTRPVVLADPFSNPLIEGGGYYTLDVGYTYVIGILTINGVGYAYVSKSWPLPGDPSEYVDQIQGDVDGDDEVSIGDVTALIDYILSNDSTGIDLDNADCDHDGEIGIADVVALIDYILFHSW